MIPSPDAYHPSKDIKCTDSKILEGKLIVHCITGSVAAYLAPEIARCLMRHGAEVIPLTLSTTKVGRFLLLRLSSVGRSSSFYHPTLEARGVPSPR